MPIIGVIDSSKSGNLYAASFDSIATVTVGAGGVTNIEFTNIPNTYTHLQIRGISRTARTDAIDNIHIRFNSDTNNNYAFHQLVADGSNVVASSATSTNTNFAAATTYGATALANTFGVSIIDILDYTNTNKNKVIRSLLGKDANGVNAAELGIRTSVWMNTNAITTITLTPQTGANITQHSQFALYGIKVA